MNNSDPALEAHRIRRAIKASRRDLTPKEIQSSADKISQQFWKLNGVGRTKRIGAYLGVNGEADCCPIIDIAWMRKKQVFLPVLHQNQMDFFPYFPDTRLIENQFGILEPLYSVQNVMRARFLDIVLVPLVAFDSNGNRIGMGGGYFDRHFAFMKRRKHWQHPRLVGVAYDFQQVSSIQPMEWDVPMSAVITETKTYEFS